MPSARSTRIVLPLAMFYGVALALIAFWPVPVDRPATGLLRALARAIPLLSYGVVEFSANVLLFVPLGILLSIAMPRRRGLVVPAALLVSGVIECGQAVLLQERTASVLDVVANTLGAAVGLLLVRTVERRRVSAVVVADRAARADDREDVEREGKAERRG